MATVSHDFDAIAGYQTGSSSLELYQPGTTSGAPGWLFASAVGANGAVTYAFRAIGFAAAGNVTVAIDWYQNSGATSGNVTWQATLAAQPPTGSSESAQAPVPGAGTSTSSAIVASPASQSVRTIITIVPANQDALTADYVAYLTINRTDAVAASVVIHRVTLSYSDGVGAVVGGPASSTVGNITTFANTAGSSLQDSGVLITNVALGAASSTAGNLPSFADAGGKQLAATSIVGARVVQSQTTAPTNGTVAVFSGTGIEITQGSSNISSLVKNTGGSTVANNLVKFLDTTGLDIRDAGIPAANVVSAASPTTGDSPVWNGTIWVPKIRGVVVQLTAGFSVTAAAATLADVTGMTFAVPRAGTYKFVCVATWTASGTAGAIYAAMNFTGTVTRIGAHGTAWASNSTGGAGMILAQTANNALAGGTTTNGVAATLGTGGGNLAGSITCSTTGTLSFRVARASASTTITVNAGSSMVLFEQ